MVIHDCMCVYAQIQKQHKRHCYKYTHWTTPIHPRTDRQTARTLDHQTRPSSPPNYKHKINNFGCKVKTASERKRKYPGDHASYPLSPMGCESERPSSPEEGISYIHVKQKWTGNTYTYTYTETYTYTYTYVYSHGWPLRKQRFQPSMSFLSQYIYACIELQYSNI